MEKRRKIIDYYLEKTLCSFGCKILKNEPLYKHCSFKIGGPADFFIEIPNKDALCFFLKNVGLNNCFILGSGTNVLFSDYGYRGIIISITDEFKKIDIFGEKIKSGGGALLSDVISVALNNKLIGTESFVGIPGTVGGAVYGNSGCKKKWINKIIDSIEIYESFVVKKINKKEIKFGYRKSGLNKCIITDVIFSLKKNIKKHDIYKTISQKMNKRLTTQPLNIPNAGSIFKNCDDFSIGELIDKIGLKGKTIGGAKISDIHGNFIVNTGKASATDVLSLIDLVKKKIKKFFNINLELEIKIIK
jgi:UDP-N-acetylmuramate dehydrogenase